MFVHRDAEVGGACIQIAWTPYWEFHVPEFEDDMLDALWDQVVRNVAVDKGPRGDMTRRVVNLERRPTCDELSTVDCIDLDICENGMIGEQYVMALVLAVNGQLDEIDRSKFLHHVDISHVLGLAITLRQTWLVRALIEGLCITDRDVCGGGGVDAGLFALSHSLGGQCGVDCDGTAFTALERVLVGTGGADVLFRGGGPEAESVFACTTVSLLRWFDGCVSCATYGSMDELLGQHPPTRHFTAQELERAARRMQRLVSYIPGIAAYAKSLVKGLVSPYWEDTTDAASSSTRRPPLVDLETIKMSDPDTSSSASLQAWVQSVVLGWQDDDANDAWAGPLVSWERDIPRHLTKVAQELMKKLDHAYGGELVPALERHRLTTNTTTMPSMLRTFWGALGWPSKSQSTLTGEQVTRGTLEVINAVLRELDASILEVGERQAFLAGLVATDPGLFRGAATFESAFHDMWSRTYGATTVRAPVTWLDMAIKERVSYIDWAAAGVRRVGVPLISVISMMDAIARNACPKSDVDVLGALDRTLLSAMESGMHERIDHYSAVCREFNRLAMGHIHNRVGCAQ